MNNVLESAKWIGATAESVSPILLRRFTANGVKKATLFVTGVGYFEAKVNGRPVTDYRFLPVVSDYEPRDLCAFHYPLNDVTTNRVYYYDFDVTALLHEGDNRLTIQLGNGFYRQTERFSETHSVFGDTLKAIYALHLETADGTIVLCSDGSETWQDSDIRFCNLFYGETVDPASVTGVQAPVTVFPPLKTTLSPAIGTPDAVIRTIAPKLLHKEGNRAVFDVGKNISGVVRLVTSAAAGERITLRFAENIEEDFTLNFQSSGAPHSGRPDKQQIMQDDFIADGTTRTFEPKFVWHCFRYFEVIGDFDTAEVLVIHSDTPVTATFKADSEGMQFLFDAYVRTHLNASHGSHPSDCPHRERLAYTGDGQIEAPAAMFTLDCRDYYAKWIRDILDSQDLASGHVQHTAPYMGGSGGPAWGSAVVLVPWEFYRQYGDLQMLHDCYDAMRRWIAYFESRRENGIVVREDPRGDCLGDWCLLDNCHIRIPARLVNSCYLVRNLRIMEEIAALTGHDEDIEGYRAIRLETEAAIRRDYYDPATGSYAEGAQGSDIFPVWCGMEGQALADKIAAKYDEMGHLDNGFLGTDALFEVLFDYGHGATALRLLDSDQLGTFLYMKRHGATTIWEDWYGSVSHNHPMFGGAARQLFQSVLGIRQRKGTAGYTDIELSPCLAKEVGKVSGSIQTVQGTIAVSVDTTETKPRVTVTAPAAVKITLPDIALCDTTYIVK